MSLKNVKNALIIFIIVVMLGGFVYSYLEGWSFIDAVYFSTVTVTTLGYGDLAPVTIAGKLFTIVFSLSGIAIGLYIITSLGKYFFTIELRKRVVNKYTIVKKNKSFDVTKMNIGELIEWKINREEAYEGGIVEIGLNFIKINATKKNNSLLPKKNQKIIKISSSGKEKKD
jgi:hypothetical protein